MALAGAVPLTLGLALAGSSGAAVTAPHFINVFPSRDFVHIEGYTPGDTVTVDLQHDPALITSLSNAGQVATATGTVGSDGIFEINHVGGTCWSGFTPDIRPGDTVKVKVGGVVVDDMVVQNVAGGRPAQTAPDTITIHGTAQGADGTPPDAAVLSSRLISPTRFFANGGKRNLNAPAVSYDAAGSTQWTATYAGLTQADIDTALSADTSAIWTVAGAAGAPVEGTSQETGANAIAGPTTGCAAPLEKVQIAGSETTPPSAPGPVTASVDVNTVTLDWGAATDADSGVQSYEILRDDGGAAGPVAVATVQNADGSTSPPPPTTYKDRNVPAGTYRYSVIATDAANNDGPAALSNSVTAVDRPAPAPQVPVNDPPAGGHSIIGFPSRDFISADGYTDAAKVSFFVIRNGNVVASAEDITPQGPTGLVEVNHPGGGCWTGNTPYLQPGDVLQTKSKDASGNIILIDQTTLADVTAQRPVQTGAGTVEIHGTATASGGGQIPVDQIESRLVTSTANAFSVNGKRTIRASSTPGTQIQGTLSYDGATSNRWTARYTGLSADDVTRALGAESRGMWLGRNPAAAVPVESTIFENGDVVAGGPGAPCTAPAAPQPKVSLDATSVDFGSVDVIDRSKSKVTKSVTLRNTGDQPLKVDKAYIAGVDAGSFTVTASACDGTTVAAGATCRVDVTFDPANTGPTTASLNFADNAKIMGFQNVPLKGTGTAGKATVSPASLSFGTVTAGSPVTKTVTVTNAGDAQLDVTPTITGATADYDIVAAATTCGALAPGATCTIAVRLNPTAMGSRTATLSIPNDTGVPTQVPLSGTGTGSTFSVSPSPVTFGTFGVNTTKSQTVGVRNTGTIAFKVTAATITGDATGAYSVPAGQACIGTVLAAGKSCNITVNLRPTAARFYSATLEVSGDASSLPAKVTASLTGTGK
jgi:hypothetical protein